MPPSSRAEGLLFLHGLESNPGSPNGRGGWTPLRPLRGLQETRVATREESGVLGFSSRRGLTPWGSLECNPDAFELWCWRRLLRVPWTAAAAAAKSLQSCPTLCDPIDIVSYSVRPHRRQPTRLRHPWDSPGRNTGVGCHFLLPCMKVKSESEVALMAEGSV